MRHEQQAGKIANQADGVWFGFGINGPLSRSDRFNFLIGLSHVKPQFLVATFVMGRYQCRCQRIAIVVKFFFMAITRVHTNICHN